MRVRKNNGRRECTKNDVAELEACRWDCVTKREVILAQELGKIVKKDKNQSKGAAI